MVPRLVVTVEDLHVSFFKNVKRSTFADYLPDFDYIESSRLDYLTRKL
jgi:hypothetical protein